MLPEDQKASETSIPITGSTDHQMIYQALNNSPALLNYLRATIYANAIGLLHAELPETTMDLKYVVQHAQSRGLCQLAEALLNLHEEGKVAYATAK